MNHRHFHEMESHLEPAGGWWNLISWISSPKGTSDWKQKGKNQQHFKFKLRNTHELMHLIFYSLDMIMLAWYLYSYVHKCTVERQQKHFEYLSWTLNLYIFWSSKRLNIENMFASGMYAKTGVKHNIYISFIITYRMYLWFIRPQLSNRLIS